MPTYSKHELETLAASLANAVGVPERDAKIFAETLIDADMQGTATHGISRLNIYLQRIEKARSIPKRS